MLGKKRPTGITVLAILNVIIGVGDLIVGLFLGSMVGWIRIFVRHVF
jgi:uncharacterized protein with GYD domain